MDWPFQDLLNVTTLTLATTSVTHLPHAAPVYFAADKSLHFYFFSASSSQHIQNLEENPQAAAAIYPPCQGWQDIRGLQMRGMVIKLVSGEGWNHAWDCYIAKFPFARKLKVIVAQNDLYAFTPRWIRMVDNRRRFGFKQEWEMP